MNLKNTLKNIDYKGLALQHFEKAVIAVVTVLFVLFLTSGIKKAMTASTITPTRIDQLADNLNRAITSSQWNESVAQQQQLKNPDFKALIAELMSGISPNQFAFNQNFFKFVDFGGVLRRKPEILSPYHALALADKGAVLVYKTDPRTGDFIEREVEIRTAKREDAEKEDDKKKKKAPKAAPRPMMGRMANAAGMSGGDGSDNMMGMMGEFMGRGSMGQQSGAGAAGMSMASGDDDGPMSGNLGASRQRRTASGIRRTASRSSDDSMFDDIEESSSTATPPAEKGQAKTVRKKKIREEEVKGIRWVLITALFPHRDQVKKYVEALHTADDPPNYEAVDIERREVLSDGSLSEWAPIDARKILDLQKRLPERWVPENQVIKSAKADFPGLMMKLPELEVGNWAKYVRREAYNAAASISGGTTVAMGRRGGDESGSEESDVDMSSLFGQQSGSSVSEMGATSPGPGMGASGMGASGMGPGGMGPGMSDAGRMGSAMARQGSGGMMGGNMNQMNQMQSGRGVDSRNSLQQRSNRGPATKPAQRTNAEIVQIRFVDYTAEPEHTYQYRLKVIVKNPNYKRLDVINNDITTEKSLSSDEWSEPTPLVYVPPDTEYYVLERVRLREEAKMQVHQWMPELGDWQFSEFSIKPGDPIGHKVREYPLVGWDDPPRIKKTELDFSTQDLLLDVTGGDKPFIFEVDGAEFKFTERLPTEVLVVDRLGDLAVRNDDFDKNNVDRLDRVKYIMEVRDLAKESEDKDKKASTKPESGKREDFEGRAAPSRREEK